VTAAITTTPISRVSCWRRKLSRPFEVQLHRRHETFSTPSSAIECARRHEFFGGNSRGKGR
jgi:hypothetical protein